MKHISFVVLALAGCTTGADTDLDDTDSDSTALPTAPCQPVVDEAFSARFVDGAVFECSENDCTLQLPASEPTRSWARGYPFGDILVMDAYDFPGILVAHGGLVHAVTVPGLHSFQAGDDEVWLVVDQSDVVAINGEGTVTQRCELPQNMVSARAAGVVSGKVVVSGTDAERQAVVVTATDTGWVTVPTETYPDGFRQIADDEVLLFAYGYAEWRNLATGEGQLLGGSDDDFSSAAICADGSYWLGGQTGMTLHCGADHECELIDNDGYPFQSQAIGCDARGWLWWVAQGIEGEPLQRGTLTTDGDVRYIEAGAGFRTGWEHYGRRWTVLDSDSE